MKTPASNSLALSELVLYLLAVPLLLFPGKFAPLGALCLLVQAVVRRRRIGSWLSSSFDLPIILFLATALSGVWVSPERSLSLNRFWVLLLGCSTYYTFYSLRHTHEQLENGLILLVVLGVYLAAASLVITDWSEGAILFSKNLAQKLPMILRLPGSGAPNPAEGVNARQIGGIMATLIPLAVSLAAWGGANSSKGMKVRMVGWLALFPLAAVLVLSQAPQAFMAVALGMTVLLAIWQPRLLVGEALLAGGLIIFSQSWMQALPPNILSRLAFGLYARQEIWRRSILIIRDQPFSGAGLNAFPVIVEEYGLPHNYLMPHAHNVFLQTAADQGMLGLVTFCLILGLAFRAGWRCLRIGDARCPRSVAAGSTAGLVAFLGFGLVDSIALGNKAAWVSWAILGLLSACQGMTPGKAGDLSEAGGETGFSNRKKHWRTDQIAVLGLLVGVLVVSPVWLSALLVNLAQTNRSMVMLSNQDDTARGGSVTAQAEKWLQYANRANWLHPGNSRAFVLAGQAHLALGEIQASAGAWEEALRLDPVDAITHLRLADVYDRLGSDQAALAHWKAAGAGEILLDRGRTAFSAGELEEARLWLTRVLQLQPATPQAQQMQAQIYARQEMWPEAIQAYQALYAINVQRGATAQILAQNLAHLGLVLSRASQVEEARQVFLQALELDPANILAQNGLMNLK